LQIGQQTFAEEHPSGQWAGTDSAALPRSKKGDAATIVERKSGGNRWLAGTARTQTMLRLGLIAAVWLGSLSSLALAQWPRQCRGDIAKICRESAKEPDRAILDCLLTNEKKLSAACRKLLNSYGHVPKKAAEPKAVEP
jgi:hypothetical protein